MRYRLLGTSDLEVSEVCLGTMTFGQQNTEAEAHQQLDTAFEMGVNFIDTAEMYPIPADAETQGSTEKYVGSWLKNQTRDKVILATKVAAHSGMTWIRGGGRLDRENIRTAVETSLKRLNTDYIDLYQIHWPDRYVPKFGGLHFDENAFYDNAPLHETHEAMTELIREGKIRHFGLSNETPWGVCKYLQQAENFNWPTPVSIQNAYNLLNRTYDTQLAEVSFHSGIPLLPYSPLGFGFLTGKYRGGACPKGSRVERFPGYPQRYVGKVNAAEAIEAYAEVAGEGKLTALALRFVASRPFVAATIIGATSNAQLVENIQAFDQPLTPEEAAAIDAIHFRYPNPCP